MGLLDRASLTVPSLVNEAGTALDEGAPTLPLDLRGD